MKCQMTNDCARPVTHLDNKGFIYCTTHGESRRYSVPCRKLTDIEIRLIKDGKPVRRY